MSDIFCVTNRKLCKEKFFNRIEKIAKESPHILGIILREKDLSEQEYKVLAEKILKICLASDAKCIIHSHPDVAKELNIKNLQMPLPLLRNMTDRDKSYFTSLGTSCHSVQEAIEAEKLGCNYIIAGHIFNTYCKRGLQGRGIEFLKNVCGSVSIPVFAIGGINADNISDIIRNGAKGTCIMSGLMTCDNPHTYIESLYKNADI